MRLLSRYIVRQLALPFVFGLLALTGIMLLNVIARRFAQLWGKGLPWSVIGEVFLLSLPFIMAMSLPLAVLAATLFAFTHLATDSEITAMRAGGVSTWGMLRPVLGFALVIGVVTFLFVDQVLPRSNARLRNLYFDIGRKKPTFQLTENVINPIPPNQQLFLRASRIEPGTGRLTSVSIYDLGLSDRRRVIYADSGVMGYDQKGRDLVLRLFDGSVQNVSAADRPAFQHTTFQVQEIVISDVFDQLERNEDQLDRGDREMTSCELRSVVDSARWEVRDARAQRTELTSTDLNLLLGLPAPPLPARGPPLPPGARPSRSAGRPAGRAGRAGRPVSQEPTLRCPTSRACWWSRSWPPGWRRPRLSGRNRSRRPRPPPYRPPSFRRPSARHRPRRSRRRPWSRGRCGPRPARRRPPSRRCRPGSSTVGRPKREERAWRS